MSVLMHLESVELVPVIELEPGKFSARGRPSPSGLDRDLPERWDQYWSDSLADSGIVGVTPLRPASWLVATRQLTNADLLGRILAVVVREWGGPEIFQDPDCRPVLDGGLALLCNNDVLIAPTCCSDLGDRSEWRMAAEYRSREWKTVWIGHPSVSVRFDAERLILSEPHETAAPVDRWIVEPGELGQAVSAADAALEEFAQRLVPLVAPMGAIDPVAVARMLAGLSD
jgi:hypothetical protein